MLKVNRWRRGALRAPQRGRVAPQDPVLGLGGEKEVGELEGLNPIAPPNRCDRRANPTPNNY
jgi:hypothetical protein